jgi:hypothetical protein
MFFHQGVSTCVFLYCNTLLQGILKVCSLLLSVIFNKALTAILPKIILFLTIYYIIHFIVLFIISLSI